MREPIRILQVVSHMDRAGTETMLMNLYRNIDREIIQFDFMMDNKNEADYDNEILALGGKVYYVPKFKIYNYFSYKKAWNEFFKDHKEHKIIHGHIGSAAAIYLKMAKKEGIYTIAHSHNNNYNKNLRGFVLSLVVKPTKYIADYFFGCSYEAGLIRYGKKVVNSNKFKVLNNSSETNKYNYDEINRE
ncbi:MAG: glycosyltransferase family 1 protein, partial [Clostridia bacterium]